jgi:hypothetical protein
MPNTLSTAAPRRFPLQSRRAACTGCPRLMVILAGGGSRCELGRVHVPPQAVLPGAQVVADLSAEGRAGRGSNLRAGYTEAKLDHLNPAGQRQKLVPRTWSLQAILSGRVCAQWVSVEGQVLATYLRDGHLALHLLVCSTKVAVFLVHWQSPKGRQWLDAQVRVRGVVSIQSDAQGQRNEVALLAQARQILKRIFLKFRWSFADKWK